MQKDFKFFKHQSEIAERSKGTNLGFSLFLKKTSSAHLITKRKLKTICSILWILFEVSEDSLRILMWVCYGSGKLLMQRSPSLAEPVICSDSGARMERVASVWFYTGYRGDWDRHLSSLNTRSSLFMFSLVRIGNNVIVSFVLLLDIRSSQCFQSFSSNLLSPC